MSRLSGLYSRVRDFSFFTFLLFFTGGALALAAWDIFWKSFGKDNRSVFTFGAALVILVVSTFLIVLARLIAARSALADVPKVFVPINREDLSKRMFTIIDSSLSHTASVKAKLVPRLEDQLDLGWGKKGTPYEGIHFTAAAVNTIETLEQHLVQISPELVREENVTVRDYVEELVAEGVLDEDLAMYYVELYERARYSGKELRETDYVEILKVTVLLCSDRSKED